MKSSLNTTGHASVCKVYEVAGDEKDINILESMNL